MGMDRRGNGHSSIKSKQGEVREGCRAAGPWELRKEPCRSTGSRNIVFTTLHLLPRSEQCRPTSSTLPRLLTGQAHSGVSAEARKVSVNVIITKKDLCGSVFPLAVWIYLQRQTPIWVNFSYPAIQTYFLLVLIADQKRVKGNTGMTWWHHRAAGPRPRIC